jgi:hypothetical protein
VRAAVNVLTREGTALALEGDAAARKAALLSLHADENTFVFVEEPKEPKWAPWQTLLFVLVVGCGFWGAVFFTAWRVML